MGKEYYTLRENPAYETEIRAWKNSDQVNAENVMNPVMETTLNNIHRVKLDITSHDTNTTKHISSAEKTKLKNIEEGAQKNTVSAVAGKIGNITLSKSDVGLGNVDNTSDVNKPLSTAMKQHTDNAAIHLSDADRTKLSGIETGANKYAHPNSGASAGTYRSVTVNAGGHVTAGSNPTTISGYGLTDVYGKTDIDSKLGTKADTSSLTSHTGNTTIHITSAERTNWNDANVKKHEHSNKSVLDSVSQAKLNTWDGYNTKINEVNTSVNRLQNYPPAYAVTQVSAQDTITTANAWQYIKLTTIVQSFPYFSLSSGMIKNITSKYLWVMASASWYVANSAANVQYGVGIGRENADGTSSVANTKNFIYRYQVLSPANTTASRNVVSPMSGGWKPMAPGDCLKLGIYGPAGAKTSDANFGMTGITVAVMYAADTL